MSDIYVVCPKGEKPENYYEVAANSSDCAAEQYAESLFYDDPFGDGDDIEVDVYRKHSNILGYHFCGGFLVNVDFTPCFTAYERE